MTRPLPTLVGTEITVHLNGVGHTGTVSTQDDKGFMFDAITDMDTGRGCDCPAHFVTVWIPWSTFLAALHAGTVTVTTDDDA